MSQNNGACPIVPWETQYDQDQQAVWCPIAQEQNYNLLDVFTGGNDPRLNKMLNVEGFSLLAQYRTVPQVNKVLSGPICMSANPPCFSNGKSNGMMNGNGNGNGMIETYHTPMHNEKVLRSNMMMRNDGMMPMMNGNGMPMMQSKMMPMKSHMMSNGNGCGVKENYCGCTTKQVALSGINQIPYR